MTRPLGLRDLGLLWQLRGQGLTLDMQRAALWAPNPLGAVLSAFLPPGLQGATLTYVCQGCEANESGFVQVLTCPERQEWQVIHLAPWVNSVGLESGTSWAGVLGGLCSLAGARGALRIRAGVVAGGSEEEAFRQAGFGAYTREEVYRLPDPHPADGVESSLRPITQRDAWPLLQLVNQVVPSTVQHAEGTNIAGAPVPILARLGVTREQGYVLERGAGLGAYVGLSRGRPGAWVRMLLHPDAGKQASDVVQQAVAVGSPAPVLYWAVREYQAGLRSLLAELGFEFVGVQVWLVRHITRPAALLRYRQLAALDKRTEPATTPLHPVNDGEVACCSRMAREHWMYEYRRADRYAVGSD